MLGTFGLRPKGTLSARALGIASSLRERGWTPRLATVPWDCPDDAGTSGEIDGIYYDNTKIVRPALWPLAVMELVNIALDFQPHLVHLFKPKGFGDLAARYLRRRGYPVVVDMDDWEGHGGWNNALPYSRAQRTVFDWQERSWPGQADAVIVASRTLQQRAIELGACDQRVYYVPNGLSRARYDELAVPAFFQPGDHGEHGDSAESNILVYTRFVEFNPEFLVEVLAILVENQPGARLIIAGGSPHGSAEVRLLAAAQEAGLSERIELLGWINPQALGAIANRCRAALVPFDDTLINRAKCSVKILELMATGLPVIASAVGENRHFLGGDYGLLARPGDAESHALLISQVLTWKQEDSLRFGRTVSERVRRNFLWDDLVGSVLDAYQSTSTGK